MHPSRRIRRSGSLFFTAVLAFVASCSDASSPNKAAIEPPVERAPSTAALAVAPAVAPNECASPKSGWVFCDDFETDRLGKYFEYDNAGGKFVRSASTGVSGSVGMRATYTTGQSSAGSLKVGFGKVPSTYFKPADAGTANYRELYWRFFVRREAGWVGNGAGKLTRATVFAKSDWSQAMIAHGWTDDSDDRYLMLDPASGTDASGNIITSGYNDFSHLKWLGAARSATQAELQSTAGTWFCYEYHVKLNDAGQSNGYFEQYIDDALSARKSGLNFVGSYNTYGLNAVFIEQYDNNGAPAANVRTYDNFVISTQPIGCGNSTPVTPVVTTVTVAIDSASLTTPNKAQAIATLRDQSGNAMSGSVTWSSSNNAIASVTSSGVVTAVAAGTATISATSNGVTGSKQITVKAPAAVAVAGVNVALGSSNLKAGTTTQATATVLDAIGNILTGRTITWSSSNTAVATVSTSGVVTAVASGSANIVASSEGKTGSAPLTVSTLSVYSISVTLNPFPIEVGKTGQATAVLKAQNGTILNGRTITWSSTNNNVATVDASGVVTAKREGNATIRARSEGRTGDAWVKVVAATSTTPVPTSLTIATWPPYQNTAGVPFSPQPKIQLLDALKKAVAKSGVVITAYIATGGGTLGGTTTATTDAQGVASFTNLSISGTDGARTLTFTSSGITGVSTGSLLITNASTPTPVATKLSMSSQPSASATAGTAFSQQPSGS